MAKTKLPLLSFGASNTIADTVTYQKKSGGTIARKKPVPAYRRTLPQVYQRWYYQNYVAWWHTLTATEKAAQETLARSHHMTGFAYWMSTRLGLLPDLALYLRFDEPGGSVAHDASPNANHSTIFGCSHITGPISNALYFDGTDDRIIPPDDPSLYPTDEITISALVKPVDPSAAFPIIIGASTDWSRDCSLTMKLGAWRNYLIIGGVGQCLTSSAVLTTDWQRVVLTYKPNAWYIFQDGVQVASDLTKTGVLSYPEKWCIGAMNASMPTQDMFNGSIDDLLILNRALTPTEAKMFSERSSPL